MSVEESKDELVHKSGKITVTLISGVFESDDAKTIQISCNTGSNLLKLRSIDN